VVDPERFKENQGGCVGQRYELALEALPDVVEGVGSRAPVPRLGRSLAFLLTVRGANLTISEGDRERLHELIEVGCLRLRIPRDEDTCIAGMRTVAKRVRSVAT
jgi:hypothetical protein